MSIKHPLIPDGLDSLYDISTSLDLCADQLSMLAEPMALNWETCGYPVWQRPEVRYAAYHGIEQVSGLLKVIAGRLMDYPQLVDIGEEDGLEEFLKKTEKTSG